VDREFFEGFYVVYIEKEHNRCESSSFFKNGRASLFLLSRARHPPTNDACACQISECKLGENKDKKTRHLSLRRKLFNEISIFF